MPAGRVYSRVMKTGLLLGMLVGGSLACLAADLAQPVEPVATWIDPDDPSVAAIRQTGESLIDRVGYMMIYEVERTVADKGLAKAIEVVHLKDLSLPKPQPGQPRVTAIRRTSLHLRNPANHPDSPDRAALSVIDSALRGGNDVPAVLVQKVENPGAPAEWRVYRPITTMPLCVKCHGPVEDLAADVRTQLALKYPNDRATGYTAFQWRGLIRISMTAPEPAVAPPAKQAGPAGGLAPVNQPAKLRP